jgi:hypothetical protein
MSGFVLKTGCDSPSLTSALYRSRSIGTVHLYLTFSSLSTTTIELHTCTTQAKRHVAYIAFVMVELITTQPTLWITLIITHHKTNTQRYLSTLCSHNSKMPQHQGEKWQNPKITNTLVKYKDYHTNSQELFDNTSRKVNDAKNIIIISQAGEIQNATNNTATDNKCVFNWIDISGWDMVIREQMLSGLRTSWICISLTRKYSPTCLISMPPKICRTS